MRYIGRFCRTEAYLLSQTIDWRSGSGVFLAETQVPCGTVFVNEKGQIGGEFYPTSQLR